MLPVPPVLFPTRYSAAATSEPVLFARPIPRVPSSMLPASIATTPVSLSTAARLACVQLHSQTSSRSSPAARPVHSATLFRALCLTAPAPRYLPCPVPMAPPPSIVFLSLPNLRDRVRQPLEVARGEKWRLPFPIEPAP